MNIFNSRSIIEETGREVNSGLVRREMPKSVLSWTKQAFPEDSAEESGRLYKALQRISSGGCSNPGTGRVNAPQSLYPSFR